jgi:hypothetical protein
MLPDDPVDEPLEDDVDPLEPAPVDGVELLLPLPGRAALLDEPVEPEAVDVPLDDDDPAPIRALDRMN